jgi:hypothetical protein
MAWVSQPGVGRTCLGVSQGLGVGGQSRQVHIVIEFRAAAIARLLTHTPGSINAIGINCFSAITSDADNVLPRLM